MLSIRSRRYSEDHGQGTVFLHCTRLATLNLHVRTRNLLNDYMKSLDFSSPLSSANLICNLSFSNSNVLSLSFSSFLSFANASS